MIKKIVYTLTLLSIGIIASAAGIHAAAKPTPFTVINYSGATIDATIETLDGTEVLGSFSIEHGGKHIFKNLKAGDYFLFLEYPNEMTFAKTIIVPGGYVARSALEEQKKIEAEFETEEPEHTSKLAADPTTNKN